MSPSAPAMLAFFVLLSQAELLAAVLLAALPHELAHYGALRSFGGEISSIEISALGARMQIRNQNRLSYGRELLAVAAGPLTNLLLAFVAGQLGAFHEVIYIFAGANLVLGIFNLLPAKSLDGGRILWLWAAWCTDPYVADRVCAVVSTVVTWVLLLGGGTLLWLQGGKPFLLMAAFVMLLRGLWQKRLVKRSGRR